MHKPLPLCTTEYLCPAQNFFVLAHYVFRAVVPNPTNKNNGMTTKPNRQSLIGKHILKLLLKQSINKKIMEIVGKFLKENNRKYWISRIRETSIWTGILFFDCNLQLVRESMKENGIFEASSSKMYPT